MSNQFCRKSTITATASGLMAGRMIVFARPRSLSRRSVLAASAVARTVGPLPMTERATSCSTAAHLGDSVMDATKTSDAINQHRRRFLGTAAIALAAAPLARDRLRGRTIRSDKTGGCARDQAGDEHVVRLAQADRCRRPECRVRRGRPHGWSRGRAAARLALRYSQLCRCGALAGIGRLPRDRTVCARLWHDALPVECNRPQRPAGGGCCRCHRSDGCSQNRKGDPWRV